MCLNGTLFTKLGEDGFGPRAIRRDSYLGAKYM